MKSNIWNSKRIFALVIGLIALALLVFVAPDYAPTEIVQTAIAAVGLAVLATVYGISWEDAKRAANAGVEEFKEVDKTADVLTALGAGLDASADELAASMNIDRETFDKVTLGLSKYLQDRFK